jgi:ornithine--oxo-acid transaminase
MPGGSALRSLAVAARARHTDRPAPWVTKRYASTRRYRMLPMRMGGRYGDRGRAQWAFAVEEVPAGRARILACNGNFHGRTLSAIAMSDEPQYRDGLGPFPPGFAHVTYGHARAPEAAITADREAFFIEPMQDESGIAVPPAGWQRNARFRRRKPAAACGGVLRAHAEYRSG